MAKPMLAMLRHRLRTLEVLPPLWIALISLQMASTAPLIATPTARDSSLVDIDRNGLDSAHARDRARTRSRTHLSAAHSHKMANSCSEDAVSLA